jgi:hypothetical protein
MGRCMLSVFTFVIIEWPREPRHAAAHIGPELIYNSSNCMLPHRQGLGKGSGPLNHLPVYSNLPTTHICKRSWSQVMLSYKDSHFYRRCNCNPTCSILGYSTCIPGYKNLRLAISMIYNSEIHNYNLRS